MKKSKTSLKKSKKQRATGTKYTPVLVIWSDSVQPHSDWLRLKEFNEFDIAECHSLGVIIKSTEKFIILAQNMAVIGDKDNQFSGAITIPKCSITGIIKWEPTQKSYKLRYSATTVL